MTAFVLLAQVLNADGLMLGGGEVRPLVYRGQTLNEACQAFSDIPARDGPLLGTASPETHLLATRYDLYLGELDGFQDRWMAVLPLWLIITAAKVPAGVVQLDQTNGRFLGVCSDPSTNSVLARAILLTLYFSIASCVTRSSNSMPF
jgi:hypothetical protein